ncbi:hypothetical protein HaLaN_16892 [Haematococcus lacustris]|uniref:Uncharacterized protein n=1 Tax=Haematococcus lacustris TaxID=44745 RepID=A0A699ZB31_HAELA|nr:hypothetical protein HaLaN_16892 [Haematococcus lacustris]
MKKAFIESTFHPLSPEVHRPSTLIKASRVLQALKPRVLELCHGQVPEWLNDAGEEQHVVAVALLV